MDATGEGPPRRRTAVYLEVTVLGAVGVLTAWTVMAVGVVAGYALAVAVAGWMGWRLPFFPWEQITAASPTWLLYLFGLAGFFIETLRFQGPPRPGRFHRAWTTAASLRWRLFLVLEALAVAVGLSGGLWWADPL